MSRPHPVLIMCSISGAWGQLIMGASTLCYLCWAPSYPALFVRFSFTGEISALGIWLLIATLHYVESSRSTSTLWSVALSATILVITLLRVAKQFPSAQCLPWGTYSDQDNLNISLRIGAEISSRRRKKEVVVKFVQCVKLVAWSGLVRLAGQARLFAGKNKRGMRSDVTNFQIIERVASRFKNLTKNRDSDSDFADVSEIPFWNCTKYQCRTWTNISGCF